ncbi:hypothetical protein AO378_0399 [Moraxella catarrhalis]|nr:hypothetical protein AO378_0399 [Moraxella catarrhalis]
MQRVGLNSKDALVYFDKHKTIDPHHTYELVEALRFQTPRLTKNEISLIHKGSQLAIKVLYWHTIACIDFIKKTKI